MPYTPMLDAHVAVVLVSDRQCAGCKVGDGQVAQLVEQRTENPCVGGSIPPLATKSDPSLCAGVFRLVGRIARPGIPDKVGKGSLGNFIPSLAAEKLSLISNCCARQSNDHDLCPL